MPANINHSDADIRRILDEYFKSGYSLAEFCIIEELEEPMGQSWVDKFYPEPADDGLMELNVNLNLRDEAKKTASKKQPTLFARVGILNSITRFRALTLNRLKDE